MCCNYCFHFEKCEKSRKTNPSCCADCAEYEFCPFIIGETSTKELDSPLGEQDNNMDIFEGDEF